MMTSETKPTKKANFLGQSPNKPSIVKPALSVTSDSRSRRSNVGIPSKSTASSIIGSRRPLLPTTANADRQGQVSRKEIRLYNEAGEDVTPRPLLQQDASQKSQQPPAVTAESSGGTPTEHASQTSVYQAGPVNASTFGGALFTRSIFSASESGRSTESVSDEFGEQTPDFTSSFTGADLRVEFKHEDQMEIPTEEELLKFVNLKLSETETLWLLDMPSVCAMSESEEALVILDRNLRYQELTKSRVGNDRYTERWMNTFNDAMKNKNIQTDKITHSDAGAYASIWDMYDTYNQNIAETNEDDDEIVLSAEPSVIKSADGDEGAVEVPVTTRTSSTLQALLPEKLSVTDTASRTLSSVGVGDSIIGSKETRRVTSTDEKPVDMQILETDNMKRHLVIVERIINLNTYQPKQALYRNFTPVIDIDRPVTPVAVVDKSRKKSTVASKIEVVADYGPNLDRLWSYQCPMTRGRNVSSISWNRVNPDLVAVGYGQFEYMKQKGGLLCCWSVKNPEFPERVYPTTSGVMCVDFSRAHPNLLAAGLHDGTIAIFNVGMSTNEPVLDSSEAPGKHTSPVFQLQWIEKERGSADEHTEVLVSVSTDGRVTQWAIRKGFESYDLMKLKRIAEKQTQSKAKKTDAMISKFAGGLCFDFTAKDSNIYLVGTEDGHVHRCSCSYNEQYLDSYFGHTGPVYTVKWSPFDPNVFLSSSGDWSVRLWHVDRLQPVLNLFSSTKAVPDLCWSPRSSTVFACVNEGALELWDLSQNTLDPILVNVPSSPDTKLSAVSFARNTECILVGDSDGQVIIYQLRGMSVPPDNQVEVLQQVISSSLASQLKK